MRRPKHFIQAATIGFLVLCGGLTAHAEESTDAFDPQFYGKLYLTLDFKKIEDKADPTNSDPRHWALSDRSSRIGVKQDLTLNDDITAFYKVEVGVEADDGDKKGQSYSQRNIYLGIKGDYGQLQAGRFSTPLRKIEGDIELFNSLEGDIKAVLGAQSRVSNIVQYSSPTFVNSAFKIAFMPGENEPDSQGVKQQRLANAISASATYKMDDFYVALGVGKNLESKTATEVNKRSDRIQLAARYQLGAVAFGTIIQHAKDSNNSDLKENAFIVNAAYRLQTYTFKAQYGLNKGDSTKNKRQLAAVGVDYTISDDAFIGLNYTSVEEAPYSTANTEEQALTLGYSQKF